MALTLSDSEEDSFYDGEDDEMSDDDVCQPKPTEDQQCHEPKLNKHLQQLQNRLGLKDLKNKLAATQSSTLPDPPVGNPEPLIVVYNDPRKRKKLKTKPMPSNSTNELGDNLPEPEEFNLIKAKHDVKKFTIKALKKSSKNQAQIALAVSLGALPPKPMATNYKLLQHSKKKEAARQKRLKDNEHIFATKLRLTNKKKGPRRDKNKVVNFDARFGKYGPGLKKQMKDAKKKKN
ncbi:uncharacterized protein C1orf131 homolog [Daphnia magna]|uniref:Uncharacterized protein n=2 Tax=Daphnia magna TaxID=35525 RepID=A0A0P5T1J1_9CRUS|nr:uncharacterized protein C1orf131 homolog [Daphnia magna]KAK4012962.1 hypothetical protein OUZ56_025210 [Daphnia magna]KZS04819.1 Uncharacterized protein APZ42_032194 [Daphnia magna]